MHRREFLLGTTAVIASVGLPSAPRQPMALITNYDLFLDGWVKRVEHTIIYSNPEIGPTQFTGFIPRYDNAA